MDFSISILKDAAEALDKVFGLFSKIGAALYNGAINSSKLFDYHDAREARRALVAVNSSIAKLAVVQGLGLVRTMSDFTANPSSHNWKRLLGSVTETQAKVQVVINYMDRADSLLATEPFFKDMVRVIMSRETILNQLEGMGPPKTPEEIEAAKAFFARYDNLIQELEKVSELLREYVARLQEKGMYPPEPEKLK